MTSPFLDIFSERPSNQTPIWFMRQAGRYLPEYMEIRKNYSSFLKLCYSPQDAARITLQPIERYDLDAAILFSDILVIPDCLGQDVNFIKSEGPVLSPLLLRDFEKKLSLTKDQEKLSLVYDTVVKVRQELPKAKGLIGFSGAPWTLALYMLEGRGSRDFSNAKREAFENEALFSDFLSFLSTAITDHLVAQVKAGVDAVQIFDSWAGLCPETHFSRWVIEPTREVVSNLRKQFPSLPVIGFPRHAGVHYITYANGVGASAVSLDSVTPMSWARERIPAPTILQGNLDPVLLVAGGKALKESIHKIKDEMRGRPYIFNLGHGILPQTPVNHVRDCVEWVRGSSQ